MATNSTKRNLHEAGLGERKIQFRKDDSNVNFLEALQEQFPKIVHCGGIELLRSSHSGRDEGGHNLATSEWLHCQIYVGHQWQRQRWTLSGHQRMATLPDLCRTSVAETKMDIIWPPANGYTARFMSDISGRDKDGHNLATSEWLHCQIYVGHQWQRQRCT